MLMKPGVHKTFLEGNKGTDNKLSLESKAACTVKTHAIVHKAKDYISYVGLPTLLIYNIVSYCILGAQIQNLHI